MATGFCFWCVTHQEADDLIGVGLGARIDTWAFGLITRERAAVERGEKWQWGARARAWFCAPDGAP